MESDHDFSADLAAQEAAARDYQPNLEGPLVGDRIPSDAISHAYAQADPVYVQKTLALPQSYSHYRPVRGDGSCGWRATFFGYFEALIRSGDASLITAERDRITQFPILGHSEMIYEDMRDEVVILMNDIANSLPNQAAAMDVLVQRFNDLDVANSILYYLRLLASSWLKSGDPSANDLAAFIPDGVGLHGYCQNYLELSDHEIEHIGLVILHNVLLKPCGIVLEIAYLDRTPGSEVNTYRIPGDAEGQDASTLGPFIHLLFRPDHYDIIYPHAPPPPPAAPLDIQVNRMSAMTPSFPSNFMYSDTDMTALTLIPGMGLGSGLPPLAVPAAPSIESYSPSPQSPWMPSPFADSLPIRQQQQQQQVPQLKQERSTPVLRAASAVPQSAVRQTDSVRFSVHCHPQFAMENETWKEPPFTTATFKNSHFNKAHYNNPNFQPEEYRPEDDENNYEPVRRNQRARRSH
ncbi:peptidase C65 Otubain-domain-containing protein [Coniochaeta sp. 2T2.1]|nr:peptidase C65 Otubain-domain-containing protein [Coniochaeta sp. 2T2.1]